MGWIKAMNSSRARGPSGPYGQRHRLLVAPLLVCVLVLLGACREDEQGRSLSYEKGTYQGNADEGLDATTRAALNQRASKQGGQ